MATTVADPPSWTTRAEPKGIARVPTHAVRPTEERRGYARAKLSLAIRVNRIAGKTLRAAQTLRTANISSSGVLFHFPQRIEPGTPVQIEVCLVDRPFGRGSVIMLTEAHIVRAERASRPGWPAAAVWPANADWHALAAAFDDIAFQRDEPDPPRFGRQ